MPISKKMFLILVIILNNSDNGNNIQLYHFIVLYLNSFLIFMIVKDVTKYLEKIAPLHLQESYDNSGLQVGDYKSEVKGVLVSLDVTMEVIDDAINQQCNLIVAHHPIIFGEIKNVTKSSLMALLSKKQLKITSIFMLFILIWIMFQME